MVMVESEGRFQVRAHAARIAIKAAIMLGREPDPWLYELAAEGERRERVAREKERLSWREASNATEPPS